MSCEVAIPEISFGRIPLSVTFWSLAWSPSGNRLPRLATTSMFSMQRASTCKHSVWTRESSRARNHLGGRRQSLVRFIRTRHRAWKIGEEEATSTLRLYSAPAYFVSVSPNGKTLTAALNERIRLVSLDSQPRAATELNAVAVRPDSLSWSPLRSRLLGKRRSMLKVALSAYTLRVWNVDNPSQHWTLNAPENDDVNASGWGVDDRSVVFRTASGRD
ncbi:MAG: hypothetical protein R3C05_15805 [Pirellulaceae bacterium]